MGNLHELSGGKISVGLDVGAVSVKIVTLDETGAVRMRSVRRHHGNPVQVVKEELRRIGATGPVAIGITGSNAALVAGGLNLMPVDFAQAEIEAVRRVFPQVRNIINVGGGSVTLIQLDENGRFLDFATNSLCAAGTGSFLDQQADRMGLKYEDLEKFEHVDNPPPIATRCSVFAKSDLIHRQQEGYSKAALWCGLCRGMTGTFLNTLLRGRPLKGLTVLTGGVSQNKEVMRWLKARYGDQVQTFEDAVYSGALGAAYLTNGRVEGMAATLQGLHDGGRPASESPRRPPLQFRKSRYPSFEVAESYTDKHGNEIRITRWPTEKDVYAYLGIDVGSTSTKMVLMDQDEKILADVYRKTGGDPIQATRYLFMAVAELCARKGSQLHVLGAGTTGSGRKLVGRIIGADIVINEITAHLTGARHVDPTVETIFEIGGQDSKYIRAKNGRMLDSNMNYVCAAGTGSFVEEQAKKLGFKLDEIGDVVMGIAPPITSDRCTVFMEQDVDRLIRAGHTREEAIAAVLCSVVKNYFTKVVGRRPVSTEKIFFQGATARNKGLVAAFENLLNTEMVVSPYCHVMGSYGVALLTKQHIEKTAQKTRFRGLDLSTRRIELHHETCDLCPNKCKITFAEIEGETERPSWGYMCGRDPDAKEMRVNREFEPFRKRLALAFGRAPGEGKPTARSALKTIGIPRSLTTYSLYPLWRRFFETLGCRVILSPRTDAECIKHGAELTAADFCFPIKLAHGHAYHLARQEGVDFIFLPHMIGMPRNPAATNSYFCPYVQAHPSVIRSTLSLHGVDVERLLTPTLDFARGARRVTKTLWLTLGPKLGVSLQQVRRAWRAATAQDREFRRRRREEGEKILAELERNRERAIVLIGRPYNTLDLGANLGLPQKIADLGLRLIPMDMLPYDVTRINPAFNNIYWAYGQEILCAAEFVRRHPNLFAIYFTNFSCGPDSFLLSFVEEVMGEKPFLTLELDEHGGDAGYMTRVEAFLDVVNSWEAKDPGPYVLRTPEESPAAFKGRKLWIPPMHPISKRLFAAALRREGYDAEALPDEDAESFEIGRSLTRGSECLPAAMTTGALVKKLRELGEDSAKSAFFMAGAAGPCRFGQYRLLQRMILNRLGYEDIPILSPRACNAYQGLSQRLRRAAWQAILSGDILFKCACRTRPYERRVGESDELLERSTQRIEKSLEKDEDVLETLRECVREFAAIPTHEFGTKPLVGIVGEIYVRCNPFSNDEIVRNIERLGGEAWLTPISEWILYTAFFHRWEAGFGLFNLREKLAAYLKNSFLSNWEHRFYDAVGEFLRERREPPIEEVVKEGTRFLPIEFSGEALITLGRAVHFARQGVSLIVNVAPFTCMPGAITSALCREIQAETNVPIVSMFYDGERGLNQRLAVFLRNLT